MIIIFEQNVKSQTQSPTNFLEELWRIIRQICLSFEDEPKNIKNFLLHELYLSGLMELGSQKIFRILIFADNFDEKFDCDKIHSMAILPSDISELEITFQKSYQSKDKNLQV